jgi:hypothetical protein
MWKFTSATIKRSTHSIFIVFIICLGSLSPAFSQQYVIANKDNTHPEITLQTSLPALITRFAAQRENDYTEVSWSTLREQDIRKYVVEYSIDGINYESAGEVIAHDGVYVFRHRFPETRPAVYRIKMELLNGKNFYSTGVLLDGIDILPVQIYPRIIQGNTVNLNAYWPVERINIFSASGQQVFAKDINGERDYMAIVIPSLGKGIYWMNFYGQGWKTTSKFIVQ